MKIFVTGILGSALLCGIVLAQDSTLPASNSVPPAHPAAEATTSVANPGAANPTIKIAPGSVIPARLTKNIFAKKLKTGDEVEAKVTQDLKAQNGEVIVPKDTRVVGRVTESQARNKDQKESQVGIAFDHLMKTDGDMALPMSIQAVVAPPSTSPNNNGSYNGAGENSPQPSMPGPGMAGSSAPSNNGNAQQSGMGSAQSAPSPAPVDAAPANHPPTPASNRPPITTSTQGVVGISNLKLSTSENSAQGSVLSSEKGNVKVESGTLILLRVNQ